MSSDDAQDLLVQLVTFPASSVSFKLCVCQMIDGNRRSEAGPRPGTRSLLGFALFGPDFSAMPDSLPCPFFCFKDLKDFPSAKS